MKQDKPNKDPASGTENPVRVEAKPVPLAPSYRNRQHRTYENPFYLNISTKLKWVKFVVVVFTVVFFLVMISVFRKDITVEKFRYFFRDLNLNSPKYTEEFAAIQYDSAAGSSYGKFKDYFVIVRPGETLLYNSSGARSLQLTNTFYNPYLLTSENTFLVYDMGETSGAYTVYNAFSALKTVKSDYPVTGAAMSRNGIYAILTRSAEYKSVVEVYDESSELICRISKDKYVMGLALSSDGMKLALVSVTDEGGFWASEVGVYDPFESQPLYSETFSGIMLYDCRITSDGYMQLSSDNGILFYDASYQRVGEFPYGGNIPVAEYADGSFFSVIFNKTVLGNEKTVQIMNTAGTLLWEGTVTGQLKHSVSGKDCVYLLLEDSVLRIDCVSGETESIPISKNCQQLVLWNEQRLMCCYQNHAESISGSGASAEETDAESHS